MRVELPRLSDDEKQQLAATLGVEPKDLEGAMSSHIAAATEEYVRMFLGQRVYTRVRTFASIGSCY